MKLFEILQVNYKSPIKPTSRKPNTGKFTDNNAVFSNIDNKLEKNPSSVLGIGADAIVFQSKRPQDAGVVTKWIRNQVNDAKNNKTIQMLVQMQQQNSTRFPKVYSIKQHNLDNGMFEFVVKMEKLYMDLNQYCEKIKDDELLQHQLINQIVDSEIGDHLIFTSNLEKISFTKEMDTLFKNIRTYSKRGQLNPQFKKALDFVRQFSKTLDMHMGNTMIRLTSTGPQVVIVDPIMDPDKFFKDLFQ